MAGICAAVGVGRHVLRDLHAEVLWLSSTAAARHGDATTSRDTVQRALSLRPRDYRYVEQAAQAEEGLRRPQHARLLWIDALQLRPGWPYAWAQLARWQFDYGDVQSAELQYSLAQVTRLGGQERGLWKMFSMQGLEHWHDDLSSPVRVFLKDALLREFRNSGSRLGGYSLVRHREDVLCGLLEKEKEPQEWCEGARFMRKICDAPPPLTQDQVKWCKDMHALWAHVAYPPE